MIEKWVLLECHYKNYWVSPIINAIRKNSSASDLKPFEDIISRITHAICIKLDMISYIESRMQTNLGLIEKELLHLKETNINSKDLSGCAHLLDDEIKYCTMIDIDSFLFEINSVCDLIGKLAEIINSIFSCDTKTKGAIICKSIMTKEGEHDDWFSKLDKSRNDFIHETAPYIAVDVSQEGHYDLLIMKENLKSFDDRDKYITLTDLIHIKNGFYNSLHILQAGLIDLAEKKD